MPAASPKREPGLCEGGHGAASITDIQRGLYATHAPQPAVMMMDKDEFTPEVRYRCLECARLFVTRSFVENGVKAAYIDTPYTTLSGAPLTMSDLIRMCDGG